MALDFDKSSLSYQQKKTKEQKSPDDLEEKLLWDRREYIFAWCAI